MTPRMGRAIVLAALLAICATSVYAGDPECEPEPASVWAPAGYVCEPHYGIGTASTWDGPGAATNGCSWEVRHSVGCPLIAIRSLDTGLVVITRPVEWCMCWVGVRGPLGETERLVDLSPDLVAALGLPGPGLYDVEVRPFREGIGSAGLPDTALPVKEGGS